MSTATISIGPGDHGRRMTLDEFEHAEGEQGYLYELGRGVIAVIDVPNRRHLAQVQAIRDQLHDYKKAHPGRIDTVAGGGECKIFLQDLDSERHPDLAVYVTAAPANVDDDDLWSTWIPELLIEIVSPSSRNRDYQEKPEEYLRFGVKEYWIIDGEKRELLVHRRTRGKWKEALIRPPAKHRTTVLPDFALDLAAVFAAAGP
ncbi:MAG: Uma2 family endonuclease [Planctomycetales bacterium]